MIQQNFFHFVNLSLAPKVIISFSFFDFSLGNESFILESDSKDDNWQTERTVWWESKDRLSIHQPAWVDDVFKHFRALKGNTSKAKWKDLSNIPQHWQCTFSSMPQERSGKVIVITARQSHIVTIAAEERVWNYFNHSWAFVVTLPPVEAEESSVRIVNF